jgi:hypothetical protein
MLGLFLYGISTILGIMLITAGYLVCKRARSPLRSIPRLPLPRPNWLSLFLGNFDVWGGDRLHADLAYLQEQYGKEGGVMRFASLGQRDCVLVLDTTIIRDILVLRPEIFPKDPTQVCISQTRICGLKLAFRCCLSFRPMAQCVVHALKGLACRASPSRAR